MASGKNVARVQGRIAENVEDSMVSYELDFEHGRPLPGVEIVAIQRGRKYKSISDPQGSFQVNLPGPGDYTMTAHLEGHASSEDEYEVSVEGNNCAEQDVGMWIDSAISGRVLDENSKPVKGIPVEMARVDEKWNRISGSAITDEDGRYEIRKLPLGEYILGVNLNGLNSSMPYAPKFYPGVSKREQAVPIRVEGARRILERDFTIESRRETRQIIVTVKWPDGSPVINANVVCKSQPPNRESMSRYTDSTGEAMFEVLVDLDFQVEADRLFWEHSARPIRPVDKRQKVTVSGGKAAATVRIIVDSINDMSGQEAPVDMSRYNNEAKH